MKVKDNNLLEFIPFKNIDYISEKVEENSNITIIIKRKSKIDKFFFKIFKKAHRELFVHLDDIGSFVWKNIDGSKNVLDLCKLFIEEYKEDEHEGINRTVHFIKILRNNKFVQFKVCKRS